MRYKFGMLGVCVYIKSVVMLRIELTRKNIFWWKINKINHFVDYNLDVVRLGKPNTNKSKRQKERNCFPLMFLFGNKVWLVGWAKQKERKHKAKQPSSDFLSKNAHNGRQTKQFQLSKGKSEMPNWKEHVKIFAYFVFFCNWKCSFDSNKWPAASTRLRKKGSALQFFVGSFSTKWW